MSYYIPHTMKHILNPEATIFGQGSAPASSDAWHPEDNLFVVMNNDKGELIGIISVDESKSGLRPSEEAVRPLEIFSSLISQIILIKKEQEERKKLEVQLLQAQKMESIGTLAGGIAHDFNNLLMGIQGHASLMALNLEKSDPDSTHIKGIEENVRSAAELSNQLLGFARGGKYEARPSNINDVIKRSATLFGRTKKEITITQKLVPDIWTVEIDRAQIQQVLLNLLVNAWQAMSGNGEIFIDNGNEQLTESFLRPYGLKSGRYVKISVADTGIGMDENTRQRAFDPFFTTKEKGRGTGLGLASAYGIVKNHDGFIELDSEIGEGTTATFYLPATDLKIERMEHPKKVFKKGEETVLFVDDEDMILDVGCQIVRSLGYTVLPAGSGKEAVAIYSKNRERINLVILDLIMPDMSGEETYRQLKKLNPDVKVLLASGYSLDGSAKKILDRGCNGFIQKPFGMETLSMKLREILDEPPYLSD